MPDETPPEIADAGWLHDEPSTPRREKPPKPASSSGDSYEVGGIAEEEEESPPVPPVPPVPVSAPPRAKAPPPERPALSPEEAVLQVWSRGAEWGPDLLRLGLVALGIALLVWFSFDLENPGPALTLLFFGLPVLILLSYPLIITLERPVRMTPEQAIRDYFGALAHHVPHYRRMWLLLSEAGRVSGEFGSFEGFRRYWKRRLAELRGARVSSITPLVFQLDGFKSDRSEDKRTADARFNLVIHARGHRGEAPLATVPMKLTLARGPDNQWYLDRGTIPAASEV